MNGQQMLVALAAGLTVVIFWGYRMWWQRRPTRAGRRPLLGAAPVRESWRRIHPAALVTTAVATAGLCWAIPLFGVTLVAFLLLDLYLGEVRRQREAATQEVGVG